MIAMRSLSHPLARLVLLLALAGCAMPRPPVPPATGPAPVAGVCRIGPDDGPILADRGIGGTGVSAEEGDRGIGGTGILGVITGFASICVNGLEVRTDPAQPVDLDGIAASAAQLRAGQVVMIQAAGPPEALRARRLAVRYEVVGPVEQRRGEAGLRVAGQEVGYTPERRGGSAWRIGDWVAVSGLRRPDGRIMATRIDRRDPGLVMVRGIVARDSEGLHIGALTVQPPLTPVSGAPDSDLRALRPSGHRPLGPGAAVTVTGRFAGESFVLESVSGDLLLSDPARAFGPGVGRLVIDSYVAPADGLLRLGRTSFGAAPPSFGVRRAVIDARREPGRGFIATELRGPGEAPGSRGDLRMRGGPWPQGGRAGPGGAGPGGGGDPMGPGGPGLRDRPDGPGGGMRGGGRPDPR